jgi:hypothetical protein
MMALQSLNLAGHRQVSSEGLAWLVHCTAMTSLDLSGDPRHTFIDTATLKLTLLLA